ncbi:protein IMPACT isoform X2 [Poecilia reticulata]|uniref:protein IMPACT isoform X2 n=1 Tax=Poecilia reticulata TaxID=8081 RepID=UPI0004A2869F|nr:PREDICTED: protein IMPACT isoform X2 [Poecilia reticulata]
MLADNPSTRLSKRSPAHLSDQCGVVARLREGQIGKQPGRHLRGARLCVRFRASALICDYLIFNREHAGESILYLWVERIREFLVEKSHSSGPVIQEEKVNVTAEEDVEDGDEGGPDLRVLRETAEKTHFFLDQANDEEIPPIKHGSPITDRRSTFQPHLAPVVTPRQVKMVLEKLYENKKIASATHNIYAYRIYCEDKHSFLQDCEDDGETAAGGRLLHLLQILDVRDVMVVVSRWYGGILLGPDRFKHINNCARNILMDEGYVASTDEACKSGAKTKRPKSKKTK